MDGGVFPKEGWWVDDVIHYGMEAIDRESEWLGVDCVPHTLVHTHLPTHSYIQASLGPE